MAAKQEGFFKGRTLAIVNDLQLDEQWYLYQKVRELKAAIKSGANLDGFRLRNPEFAVYTIFMEDSTRTKESFRNAAEFHGMKTNVFDAKTSSFQKNETITDTIKMLCGYSIGQSIFVIRSKIEGVCRWLEEAIGDYTEARGYPPASFINAGDGRHEHPSQELLDEFSFLEHKGWDRDSIHLALLGDLFHGRTVHSKVDGLRLYTKVEVDLIAPGELALPKMYEDRMLAAGFTVRKFASIEEYLAQAKVAKIWYFTRLQLERMGEKVLLKSVELRKAVTFRREFVDRVPEGAKFFHPLPRDARHPTLPFWLDGTQLNGWDQQSQNGYFTRIVLLGMVGGLLGRDYEGASGVPRQPSSPMPKARPPGSSPIRDAADFIVKVPHTDHQDDQASSAVGLVPLANGIIIENLAEGQSVEQIWGLMNMVRSILGLTGIGGQGVYRSAVAPESARGYISVPELDINGWDRGMLKKLTAMAPGSRLKVVEDGRVCQEYQLCVPPQIYNFPDISCNNTACVSHPGNGQHEVPPHFFRAESPKSAADREAWAFSCKYCESRHDFWQIWDYRQYEVSDFML
mmetsp:Transcript_71198/g.189305  ORF Transcript_71198/g.189305 Transcript_71198/m.189305 type:complete len:571 (-) Transcript_71198:291-2003(-)